MLVFWGVTVDEAYNNTCLIQSVLAWLGRDLSRDQTAKLEKVASARE